MPKIDIYIKRKRPVVRSAASRKGPIDFQRDPDYLKRRLQAPKGINFWDMGQISDGSGGWIDTSEFFPTDVAGTPGLLALDTSMFSTRDTPLFAVPTADWPTKFRKITKGGLSTKYMIDASFGAFGDALDNLSQWTAGGLVVSQTDLNSGLFVSSDPSLDYFFDGVRFLDSQSNRKITGTNDYTGPAVAFSPIPLMDVFLPPKFVRLTGRSQLTPGPTANQQAYSYDFLTFPRDFIINASPVYRGGTGVGNEATTIIDAGINAAISTWKAFIPGRDFSYNNALDTYTPGGTFNPGIGAGYAFITPVGPDGRAVDNSVNGSLLAVVKKGPSFYYFWTDGF